MTKPIEVALEKKRTILRSRAKKLSQEIESKGTGEEYFEVLEFLLAQETYAIETNFVREVYPMTELTPLEEAAILYQRGFYREAEERLRVLISNGSSS